MAELLYTNDVVVFKYRGGISSDESYDNAIFSGIYRIGDFNSNAGYPTNGVMYVFTTPSKEITFQLFSNYDGHTRCRIFWYGTWKGWKLVAGS